MNRAFWAAIVAMFVMPLLVLRMIQARRDTDYKTLVISSIVAIAVAAGLLLFAAVGV